MKDRGRVIRSSLLARPSVPRKNGTWSDQQSCSLLLPLSQILFYSYNFR